jgi:hypothetical protein
MNAWFAKSASRLSGSCQGTVSKALVKVELR